ncbi:nitrate/nitrite transporter [Massilia sp. CF038]|uniref:MFS transporter n=1 Tax=Massilia sp. CF038 TaxID=1881045 RepID=UPI00091CAADE|nr:MFS transporter [Massilia sp. CF038]SHH30446.1 Sugar phosphate permease [Massilia sp. CF038]
MSATLKGAAALRVFSCFAFGYLLSYALRSINAVIAPALVTELHLSNADLGLLSSAYFVAFGCMQLPLGIWLDKYGPRRTEAALLLLAALGALVFASSSTLMGLWIGRALIGIGVSACLMAALKGYRQWFPMEQQGRLASWMLMAGTSGALSASVPVTLLLPHTGWRALFYGMALLLLLTAAGLFFLLRDAEQHADATVPVAANAAAGGYRTIFRAPYFWRIAALGFVNHAMFAALQTLWAGPWLTTVLGASEDQASGMLFAMNLILMLAYLALGWAAPRLVRAGWDMNRLIIIGTAGMALAQAAMVVAGGSAAWLLLLVLALCVPVTSLVQSGSGLAFPAALAGRANAAYNLTLFLGAFTWQWGFGVLVDLIKAGGAAPAMAFRLTMAAMVLLQLAALGYFLFHRVEPDKYAQ